MIDEAAKEQNIPEWGNLVDIARRAIDDKCWWDSETQAEAVLEALKPWLKI